MYESEGIAIQQRYLGGLVGAFTTDIGSALDVHAHLGIRRLRRSASGAVAELQADERVEDFLAQIQPLIHTQREPDPDPDLVLAAQVSRLAGQGRARHRRRAGDRSGDRRGARCGGRDGRGRRPEPARGRHPGGRRERGRRPADGRRDARAPRPPRHPDQQRRPLRIAGDAAVHGDPARGVAAGDGRERRLDVPDLPGGRAGDARAGRRQDREHLVGDAVPRRAVPAPLRDLEGRDRRLHPRARKGARQGRRST